MTKSSRTIILYYNKNFIFHDKLPFYIIITPNKDLPNKKPLRDIL
ncbi:hypothetical protein HMPREF0379_0148 [[Eubacterium] yurii subsp. margaretiae ATCC 43715]|nr:hypothetical protein HMPREF0379_0148 [[Eubacterium] yurii subsp. margaretiae ATCC 43715]